jgi:tRNA U34 5-carboxymethylaminomethyl modifying GTPase MnmE/TrmE
MFHVEHFNHAKHFESLQCADWDISLTLGSVCHKMTDDFIAFDIRNAANSLSEVIGIITMDDILNNTFCKFYLGR